MSEETRRADKAEFEATRAQEKTTQLQAEAEVRFQACTVSVLLMTGMKQKLFWFCMLMMCRKHVSPSKVNVTSEMMMLSILDVGALSAGEE